MQTLILVDKEDNFLGYAPRDVCHLGNGKLHRAISVIVVNTKKEILLQKRKSHLWDGFWDITGATHPLHLPDRDETYEESTQRCLREEWNLDIPVRELFSFIYFERFNEFCENEHCALLVGEYNNPVRHNSEYAYDMRWSTLDDCLSEMKKNLSLFTPWAKIVFEKLSASPF